MIHVLMGFDCEWTKVKLKVNLIDKRFCRLIQVFDYTWNEKSRRNKSIFTEFNFRNVSI